MKLKQVITLTVMLMFGCTISSVQAQDRSNLQRHGDFTVLLAEYVDGRGLVNYDQLCDDDRLDQYTQMLSATQWDRLNRGDQLAFWINAYNAFTLKVICDNYPVDSISELHKGGLALSTVFKTTIWDKEWFEINGQSMSLGYIEHEVLRKGDEKERIHFAIVCAAVSCPPLRQEAYEGYKIDVQLDDQGNTFLSRTDLNEFDVNRRTARLSGIFKWFMEDYGDGKEDLLRYLERYAPNPEVAESLRIDAGQWKIRWKKYDWSLNRFSE